MATIVVFAFDITEAAQIRRIKSLIRLGHDVRSISFRRGNMNADFAPDWPNLHLGHMPNGRFAERCLRLLAALPRLVQHGSQLRDADVVIARNFDILALAWAARAIRPGTRARLVYECLDIHGLFTGRGPVGRVMRFLERRLLARIDLLWVSSPGFMRSYFKPVQRYRGPFALIENKLWSDGPPQKRPTMADRVPNSGPLVLGWVGSIRCSASLDLLAAVARRLGPDIRIAVHGSIHSHAVPDFEAVVAAHDNMSYHGPYTHPDIYLGLDAVWAQDLWQRGGNSDWLLPNRIYEASWFGCPSIAVADTETGRRVASAGLGYVIGEASAEDLTSLLSGLDRAALRAASASLLAMPDSAFRLESSDIAAALGPVISAQEANPPADAVGSEV